MAELESVLLTPQVLGLAAGIVALLWFLGRIPIDSKRLADVRWWRRILPVLPLVVGVAAAFAPGVTDIPTASWGSRLLFGLWCGFVAAHGRKVFKRFVLDNLSEKKDAA